MHSNPFIVPRLDSPLHWKSFFKSSKSTRKEITFLLNQIRDLIQSATDQKEQHRLWIALESFLERFFCCDCGYAIQHLVRPGRIFLELSAIRDASQKSEGAILWQTIIQVLESSTVDEREEFLSRIHLLFTLENISKDCHGITESFFFTNKTSIQPYRSLSSRLYAAHSALRHENADHHIRRILPMTKMDCIISSSLHCILQTGKERRSFYDLWAVYVESVDYGYGEIARESEREIIALIPDLKNSKRKFLCIYPYLFVGDVIVNGVRHAKRDVLHVGLLQEYFLSLFADTKWSLSEYLHLLRQNDIQEKRFLRLLIEKIEDCLVPLLHERDWMDTFEILNFLKETGLPEKSYALFCAYGHRDELNRIATEYLTIHDFTADDLSIVYQNSTTETVSLPNISFDISAPIPPTLDCKELFLCE